MLAAVLRGKTLATVERPEPEIGEGQVLVRTLACGICGSDLHAHHHLEDIVSLSRQSGAADNIDPASDLVMGHEFCCEILEHGPGTDKRLKVGTHAVAQAKPGPASVCVVIGCGPVGLAVIVALKRQGIGPVIACDFSPARRALAEKLGADIVLDPAQASPHDYWETFDVPATLATLGMASLTGRNIRDAIIFDCVGVPGMLPSLIQNAPPTAHIVVVGACMEEASCPSSPSTSNCALALSLPTRPTSSQKPCARWPKAKLMAPRS